jgi:beta-lactamase regulating signal transducer with metallopeptidase domain
MVEKKIGHKYEYYNYEQIKYIVIDENTHLKNEGKAFLDMIN